MPEAGHDFTADLVETGALLEGHFLLTSGRHSNRFFLLSRLVSYPDRLAPWLDVLAAFTDPLAPTAVLGPAMGGVILAWALAERLASRPRALFAEKLPEGGLGILRGFRLDAGDRVMMVEDALTTGGSVLQAARAAEAQGAHIVGVATLVDRRPEGVTLPYPTLGVCRILVPAWDAAECPLCLAGAPLERPKGRSG
jgi:orotate phosphoribosyltransferase